MSYVPVPRPTYLPGDISYWLSHATDAHLKQRRAEEMAMPPLTACMMLVCAIDRELLRRQHMQAAEEWAYD
jgi:hypothetical protein